MRGAVIFSGEMESIAETVWPFGFAQETMKIDARERQENLSIFGFPPILKLKHESAAKWPAAWFMPEAEAIFPCVYWILTGAPN
jgi:hypothetical protein